MHHALDITTARLTAIHRHFGTITDISLLGWVSVDELYNGPMLFPDDVKRLEWGLKNQVWEKWGDVVFARDGRKVLAFARQYETAYNHALSETIIRGNAESFDLYARYALKWIVTADIETAHAKMKELHESEPDAGLLDEVGAGWIRSIEIDAETETKSGRVIARAFIDARDNMEKHLELLWLERFEDMGIEGAVKWMREFWQPSSEEAKAAINAAYLSAKRKFKTK